MVETVKDAKAKTVYGFEVDEGKDDIIRGTYHANLAGRDLAYSMDSLKKQETQNLKLCITS